MRLRLEATEQEIQEKAPELIKVLAGEVRPHHPELADDLEKALPKKEPALKYKALQDLHSGNRQAYSKTLDQTVKGIQEILENPDLYKSKMSKAAVMYLRVLDTQYECKACNMFVPDKERCTVHTPDTVIKPYGSCGLYHPGQPMGQAELHGQYTKRDTGYAENPHQQGFSCKRCVHFKAEESDCAIVDRESPGDDKGVIHPDACCNAQELDPERAKLPTVELRKVPDLEKASGGDSATFAEEELEGGRARFTGGVLGDLERRAAGGQTATAGLFKADPGEETEAPDPGEEPEDPDYDPESGEPIIDPKTGMTPSEEEEAREAGELDEDEESEKSLDGYSESMLDWAWLKGDAPMPDHEYLQKAGRKTKRNPHGGPFMGPRGGLWADPQHKIHWDPEKHGPVPAKMAKLAEEKQHDDGSRYDSSEAIAALEKMGDRLHIIQGENPYERDASGFSRIDMDNWPRARGNLLKMRKLLAKYRRQLMGPDYWKAGLGDQKADLAVKMEIHPTFGSLNVRIDGYIKDKVKFSAQLALHKELGFWFSRRDSAWVLKNPGGFDYEGYIKRLQEAFGDLVIDFSDVPEPRSREEIEEQQAERAAKEKASLKEKIAQAVSPVDLVWNGLRTGDIDNAAGVKWNQEQGTFEFRFPKFTKVSTLFSNKRGGLPTVTWWDNTTEPWTVRVFDVDTACLAIKYIKDLYPDWEIATEGLEEAIKARDEQRDKNKVPIPEVAAKLAPGLKLFDYQNEGVRFLLDSIDPTKDGGAILGDEMGLGKGLVLTEKVLTPEGWRPIGDISVGDLAIGRDGRPTKVTGVYPQGKRPTYRFTLNDGASVQCDDQHLWAVQHRNDRVRSPDQWRTMSTTELLAAGLYDGAGNRKWWIPMCEPVMRPMVDVPVEPYLLGVLLGDGSLGERSVSIASDEEILRRIGMHQWREIDGCVQATLPWDDLREGLRSLELMGCRAWEKFVPAVYLQGDVTQRLALLQGLLDTDGFPMAQGGVEFCSTSEALVDAVVELAESLGGSVRNKTRRITDYTYAGERRKGRPSWRVNVKLPPGFKPFRLTRKLEKWVEPTKYPPARLIKSIEPLGDQETVCIAVDAPDKLFVIQRHIVTHNTLQMLSYAVARDQKLLVVAPKTVRRTWLQEANKFFPEHFVGKELDAGELLKVTRKLEAQEAKPTEAGPYAVEGLAEGKGGATPENIIKALGLDKANIATINYESIAKFEPILREAGFQVMVMDESHRMKNPKAKLTQAINKLGEKIKTRILMSGTAVKNKKEEFATQFEIVRPGLFKKIRARDKFGREHMVTEVKRKTIGELWHRMRPFYIARQKDMVLAELPPKTLQVTEHPVTLAPDIPSTEKDVINNARFFAYADALDEGKTVDEAKVIGEDAVVEVKDALVQLRGDFHMAEQEGERPGSWEKVLRDFGLRQITASGTTVGAYSKLKSALAQVKTEATKQLVDEILEGSESNILIFTNSKGAVKELKRIYGDNAVTHFGDDSHEKREKAKSFFHPDTRPEGENVPRILIGTMDTLKEGATLTSADKVVFNDLPWTAAEFRQAEARAHRPGQDKPVDVYWVTAEGNTLDNAIATILRRKVDMTKKWNEGRRLSKQEDDAMNEDVTMEQVLAELRGETTVPETTRVRETVQTPQGERTVVTDKVSEVEAAKPKAKPAKVSGTKALEAVTEEPAAPEKPKLNKTQQSLLDEAVANSQKDPYDPKLTLGYQLNTLAVHRTETRNTKAAEQLVAMGILEEVPLEKVPPRPDRIPLREGNRYFVPKGFVPMADVPDVKPAIPEPKEGPTVAETNAKAAGALEDAPSEIKGFLLNLHSRERDGKSTRMEITPAVAKTVKAFMGAHAGSGIGGGEIMRWGGKGLSWDGPAGSLMLNPDPGGGMRPYLSYTSQTNRVVEGPKAGAKDPTPAPAPETKPEPPSAPPKPAPAAEKPKKTPTKTAQLELFKALSEVGYTQDDSEMILERLVGEGPFTDELGQEFADPEHHVPWGERLSELMEADDIGGGYVIAGERIMMADELHKTLKPLDEPLAFDPTADINEREQQLYDHVKKLTAARIESVSPGDFDKGGKYYGWSTNQLLEAIRGANSGKN